MGKYYIGKGAQLLTEESEEKIRIRQLERFPLNLDICHV